jgi:HD-GYP domain-containing protein (c-di-GMP phosphodiesterase class II)
MSAEWGAAERMDWPSLGHAAARRELERCAGTQFDRDAVEALIAVLTREAERAQALLASA